MRLLKDCVRPSVPVSRPDCPLVDESDNLDIAAAEERHTMLRAALPEANVALVHGRMDGETRDTAMENFRSGESRLLVATTVVEVGVDVPNASIMIIEHAERFGLSQLHQLRGRVGRGHDNASCLLLYKGPVSDTARSRLSIMRESNDGFRIAEEDLRLRGPGEVLGRGSQETLTSSLLIWPITVICLPLPMMRLVIFSAAIRALKAPKVSGLNCCWPYLNEIWPLPIWPGARLSWRLFWLLFSLLFWLISWRFCQLLSFSPPSFSLPSFSLQSSLEL